MSLKFHDVVVLFVGDIYTKLIRLDIYLKRTSGVFVIVRSFLLPKGSPDSKTDGYAVRAMLFIDALASVTS
jgi:hypothetical protein